MEYSYAFVYEVSRECTPILNSDENWSRIHECTISLWFQGIILRVLRPEVSVYNVYVTNQSQTTFVQGGGGGVIFVSMTVNSKEEIS